MAIRVVGEGRWGRLSCRRDMSRWKPASCVISGCLVGFLCLVAIAAPAGSGTLNEEQLKAAYLYNFARYVEWPESAHESSESAIEIGVVGSRVIFDLLKKAVIGKTVGRRSLRVLDFNSSFEGRKSHILFVAGELSEEEWDEIIEDLKGTHVFVVAGSPGFAKYGGIANFIVADSRVRFAINKAAADKAGLKVSSKLLRLAELVERGK